MANHDPTEPLIDVVVDLALDRESAPDPAARERARWQLLAKKGSFRARADCCEVWVGNTRDVDALDPTSLAELMDSITAVGQQVPAIARISPSNAMRLEIIAGARRLAAIRRINDGRPSDDQLPIKVDLRELDDKAALMVVDAENRGRSDMSVLEKARFYQSAIERIYHAENVLAEALGLNKSTVNRTLAILKLPSDLFGIQDPHKIIREEALDSIVIDALLHRLLEPDRLQELLAHVLEASNAADERRTRDLQQARAERTRAETGIAKLLELVETGLMSARDPVFAKRLGDHRARVAHAQHHYREPRTAAAARRPTHHA